MTGLTEALAQFIQAKTWEDFPAEPSKKRRKRLPTPSR